MNKRIERFKELNQKLKVGTVVKSKRKTGICQVDEVGICYEVYKIGDLVGFSIIFEHGGYDGFAPDEIDLMIEILTQSDDSFVNNYQFDSINKLTIHHAAGKFDKSFKKAYHSDKIV